MLQYCPQSFRQWCSNSLVSLLHLRRIYPTPCPAEPSRAATAHNVLYVLTVVASQVGSTQSMPKSSILLTDEIVPPPALVRAGLEALPAIIRTYGEHARRRFIEFFTASIRTATLGWQYVRAVKQCLRLVRRRRFELADIEAITIAKLHTGMAARAGAALH
jgi:hypothetical protein